MRSGWHAFLFVSRREQTSVWTPASLHVVFHGHRLSLPGSTNPPIVSGNIWPDGRSDIRI
jgi:hypothetical protein